MRHVWGITDETQDRADRKFEEAADLERKT
jgi:hypothetical protein